MLVVILLPEHYQNAKEAVKLLYDHQVTILAGSDANPGYFSISQAYGKSIYREIELLVQAGMSKVDVLADATSNIGEVFNIDDIGKIEVGKKATLLLIEGKVDGDIKK